MAKRLDFAPMQSTHKTDAGFLRGEANITRTGVFTYRFPDGTVRRELRLPEEVFNADSLASFAMAPITLDHPVVEGAVTAENAKRLVIGSLGENVRKDGRFVRAPFVIHDSSGVQAVESGDKRQLSCGYDCDLEMAKGVHDGEPYDAIQRNIRGNHVALLARGKAGPEAAIRLDAEDAICVDVQDADDDDNKRGKKAMKTIVIKLDGVDFEVPEQVAQAINVQQQKHAQQVQALTDQLKEEKAGAEKAKGRADALEAEVKTLKDQNSPDKIREQIKARSSLETRCLKVLGSDFKADGVSDHDLKLAVIKKLSPSADLTGKAEAYVDARFDAAMELHSDGEQRNDAANSNTADVRNALTNSDGTSPVKTAQQKMIERNRARWQDTKQSA